MELVVYVVAKKVAVINHNSTEKLQHREEKEVEEVSADAVTMFHIKVDKVD